MRMVRSAVAHGRLVSIDAAAALALPGVVAVWTNADIADIPPIDFRADKSAEILKPYRQPALARDFVRYVGDPVAAVFAEEPYLAEDAAELVAVEIEELPPLLSASDEPGEFEPGRSSEAAIYTHSFGDIDAAFRSAHTVVELDLQTGRHSGVPLETRGAHRALRRRARHSGTARRRENSASQSRDAVPHAQSQPVATARAREPCRRRLRHPR